MADRYWVGGAGTWDATTTTNWAATSGGASGASAPTSVDNVIFNTLSNATLYTVTVGTNAVCNDLTAAGPLSGNVTFSLGTTAVIDCYGSMTLPATGLVWTSSGGSAVTFRSTTTGKTVTTNGVSLSNTNINFNGIGGAWTLGFALSNSGALLNLLAGTLDSANFNITCGIFRSASTSNRTLTLGSSTFTTTNASSGGWENIDSGSTFTLNAGTSQIISSGAFTWLDSSSTFTGKTFYNVRFNRASGMTVSNANTYNEIDFSAPSSNAIFAITGSNTIANLKIASLSATGTAAIVLSANQTVTGTLTLGTANTAIRRIQVQSNIIGTFRTITLNGTLATLADVDFRDIDAAGSFGTWTGTRIGNGGNNYNIGVATAKDVYWNLVAGGDWSATGWALSSGGAVAVNNFPLAQDKVIFENTGLNTSATITLGVPWWIGELDASTRSNAMTFSNSTATPIVYKNVTLSSAFTMTGTGVWSFVGQGTTQILDTNTATFVPPITINSATGTLQLAEDATCSATVTLTSGTLSLNNFNLTCLVFNSTNTNTRAIAFGTGNITVTGSGIAWTTATPTNFSYTGTPTVNISNNSATSTTINTGLLTELQALNFNYTIGTYTLIDSTNCVYRSVNFTGFAGTIAGTARAVFGNYTLSTGMTLTAGTGITTFAATSGTQLITTNGKTIDNPITQNGVGGTVQLQDNLTMGSTRTFTLTNGSFNVNGKVFTTGIFSSSNSNTRTLNLGANGRIAVNGGNYTTTTTGLTFSGTGTISMDLATAKTFAGGGGVYPFALNQGGAGTLTITGANTFADMTNTNATASQITFPASTITSVNALSIAGSSGNLVSMRSSTPGTPYTIKLV